mgnify:CR=1 FL=1
MINLIVDELQQMGLKLREMFGCYILIPQLAMQQIGL